MNLFMKNFQGVPIKVACSKLGSFMVLLNTPHHSWIPTKPTWAREAKCMCCSKAVYYSDYYERSSSMTPLVAVWSSVLHHLHLKRNWDNFTKIHIIYSRDHLKHLRFKSVEIFQQLCQIFVIKNILKCFIQCACSYLEDISLDSNSRSDKFVWKFFSIKVQ